jgi:hypothetical protein
MVCAKEPTYFFDFRSANGKSFPTDFSKDTRKNNAMKKRFLRDV